VKVIGFVGSPRKDGNTDVLVQQVLNGVSAAGAETRIFYLNELNIKGCQGCNACKVNDKCALQDDMTALYDEIAEADGLVLGSPVYLSYLSGQTKCFLDRWYALLAADYTSKLKQGKKIVLVYAQANPDGELYRQSFASLSEFLNCCGIEVLDTLVAAGVGEAGAVTNDDAFMKNARETGERLVKVIKMAHVFKKPDAVSGPSKGKRNRT